MNLITKAIFLSHAEVVFGQCKINDSSQYKEKCEFAIFSKGHGFLLLQFARTIKN